MLDAAMHLPDGRTLAYTDLGPADGALVIYAHGAPTSRLDLVALEPAFDAAHVRVVSPDRPGYGGSSPQPSRTLADWAGDAAALADHLGRDRFALLGISAGGPYVVACTALLPDRVTNTAVVAGVTDMAWPGSRAGFDDDEVTVMDLDDDRDTVRWAEDRYGADGSRFFDRGVDLAPADQAMLADPAIGAGLVASMIEAFRQGVAGYALDLWTYTRPWPFDPSTIRRPVTIVHGEADTVVPLSHSRHTAELIPDARLLTFPDHGHLSIIGEFPRLVAELATSLR